MRADLLMRPAAGALLPPARRLQVLGLLVALQLQSQAAEATSPSVPMSQRSTQPSRLEAADPTAPSLSLAAAAAWNVSEKHAWPAVGRPLENPPSSSEWRAVPSGRGGRPSEARGTMTNRAGLGAGELAPRAQPTAAVAIKQFHSNLLRPPRAHKQDDKRARRRRAPTISDGGNQIIQSNRSHQKNGAAGRPGRRSGRQGVVAAAASSARWQDDDDGTAPSARWDTTGK